MTQHAKLSPSSAERWINCTASVGLIDEVFPDGVDNGGEYAQEGTWAHRAAELKAMEVLGLASNKNTQKTRWRRWKNEVPEHYHEEMLQHASGYADVLQELRDSMPSDPMVLLEARVNTGVPGVWGTVDCILADEHEVIIMDFKYGRGVGVHPEDNMQLQLYGLGAVREVESVLTEYTPETKVTLVVHQPRAAGAGGTWTTTVSQLVQFRENLVIPAVHQITTGDTKFAPSESACRWCPVSGRCTAQTEWATNRDFAAPDAMSPEDISEALGQLKELESWCKAVRDQALRISYDENTEIPGWKVVRTSGRRVITEHAEAIEALQQAGYPPEKTSKTNTQTITVLQKLVGSAQQLEEILGGLLARTEGKLTLVTEDDKREALNSSSSAVSDFQAPLED